MIKRRWRVQLIRGVRLLVHIRSNAEALAVGLKGVAKSSIALGISHDIAGMQLGSVHIGYPLSKYSNHDVEFIQENVPSLALGLDGMEHYIHIQFILS